MFIFKHAKRIKENYSFKIIGYGLVLIVVLSFTIICIYYSMHSKSDSHDQNILRSKNNTILITKTALEDLINRAANQKYLQDVLESGQKLPLPKQNGYSLPKHPVRKTAIKSANYFDFASKRCSYQGQSYVAGDIVKIPQGWIKCSPIYLFNPRENKLEENKDLAWVVIQ